MVTLCTEGVDRCLTRGRQLPCAAIGKLETRARASRPTHRVKCGGQSDCLREVQGYGPAAKSSRTAVGYAHVHLEEGAARVRRRRRTGVRSECLIAQQ